MALFKIFQGSTDDLDSITFHDGYAYFVPKDGMLYIDAYVDGETQRVQLNSSAAEKLSDGSTTIEIDDIVLKSAIQDIEHGGTNATTAADARTNLGVYSETEVDNKVTAITATRYDITLSTSSWSDNTGTVGGTAGAPYTYNYSLSSITCGANGNICPLITKADGADADEYAKITSASATPGTGIVFTAEEELPATIDLIVIDFGSPV